MENKPMKKIVFTIDDMYEGIYALSIVNQPAIESNFIALSKNKVMLKVDEERRMLFGPVLIPNKEILRIDEKTGEKYTIMFPPETIVMAQQMFFKKSHQNDHTYEHQFKIEGLTVVESWIKESEQDKSVHLGFDEPIGTLFFGTKVENEDAWARVKSGEVKGFSIEGSFAELSKHFDVVAEIEQLIKSNHK
jgi:hypothetical protein